MTYGSASYGSASYGSSPAINVTFDLDKPAKDDPVIVAVNLFGADLIRYFLDHPDDLKTMDRRKFEELVAELFKGFGYDVELTQQTRDGGRDIIAVKHHETDVRYLVECKRPNPGKIVGVGVVRSLLGVVHSEKTTGGILVTTAYFSKPAKLFFEQNEWQLQGRDFDALIVWLKTYFQI